MIKENEPLAQYTTLKVGGAASHFAVVNNEAELAEAVSFANDNDLALKVLGGGSNLLIPDSGISGLVIRVNLKGLNEFIAEKQILLTVAAGENFDDLVAKSVKSGWWGLENLSHIPGSVGATPVQNVGAYGVEVKDLIDSVRVFDTKEMTYKDLSNDDCQFGYRDSIFKHDVGSHYIVTAVTFKLSSQPNPRLSYRDLQTFFNDKNPDLSEIREAIIKIRSKKFPDWHQVGTAGSFFKNPIIDNSHYQTLKEKYAELPGFELPSGKVKVPLGWILDKALNLKGFNDGGPVGTYEGQALVLVNLGNAKASDIKNFAQKISTAVKKETDITIEWEVTRW